MAKRRFRMFGGPNGSGKTTLFKNLKKNFRNKRGQFKSIGTFFNADELERQIKQSNKFNFSILQLQPTKEEWIAYLNIQLAHWGAKGASSINALLQNSFIQNNYLEIENIAFDSYQASMLNSFIVENYIKNPTIDFCYETVMSHRSKIELLKNTKRAGYKNYLYYVCTEDPTVNEANVALRVRQGGHNVPDAIIQDRYYKSLGLLKEAIRHSDRTFLFHFRDGSHIWIATIEKNEIIFQENQDNVPLWVSNYIIAPS